MVQLLNSIYLGAAKPEDYGKAAGVVELLPFDYYLGAAVPSHGKPTINVLLSGVSPLTLLNAVSLNYVKAFGKCEQASTPTPTSPVNITANNGAIKVKDDELPVGYKRLLDISTSGDIRYVSNVYLTGEDTLKFRFKAAPGNLIGAYNDADADDNYSFYNSTSAGASYARYNGQTGGSATYTGTEYSVTMSPTGVTGIRNPSSFTPTEFTCSIPFCVFATSPVGSSHGNATIYGSIEVTGSQNLKLIPCERVSDSAIGYYETSNGEFLENQESGTPTTSGYDTSHLTEIYYDGTVETVQAHGKNLFDRDTVDQNFVSGKIKNNNGEEVNDATSTYSTTYIKVSPSTSYSFSWIGGSAVIQRIYYYTENKQWISRTQSTFGQSPAIFTTPNNCEYIQIQRQTSVYVAATNIQLELGSTATDYEPYFEGTTATCQPLLSVGTYKDVQNITNGDITRNVGVKVFDGTENWTLNVASGVNRYNMLLSDAINIPTPNVRFEIPCTHFRYEASGQIEGICFLYTNKGLWFIPADNANIDTVDKWKAWLASQYAAGTPVIVVYPLATPTTESVTGQTLTITQGTNIVSAEGSVSDLELEVSYKGYAEVTVEEIEAVNTDESVDVIIS